VLSVALREGMVTRRAKRGMELEVSFSATQQNGKCTVTESKLTQTSHS